MNREDQQKIEAARAQRDASGYREANPAFAHWAAGCGPIEHRDETQVRVYELVARLAGRRRAADPDGLFRILAAADRLACAGMWLVVHATYARNVYLDGRALGAGDFKAQPEGHTGGALNMVPAYVGYLAANALDGLTRSWIMGQGHCVSAIDSINVLAGNASAEQAARYQLSDQGLGRFVRDFYSYALRPDGRPEPPLGSHVNPHTAGGLLEGGYLGFAELQYVHIPLPGERLVAFLSDGAFEEQRGSDWAPRWWRAEDTGLVTPILIANGRRIDQRTTVAQQGGVEWLHRALLLNGFDPMDIDGRDPAAFAWAILEMEDRLTAAGEAARGGRARYPIPLPYAVAETIKGFGFPGAGSNAAHNLPLPGNPSRDEESRQLFNRGARALWVPAAELEQAVAVVANHAATGRARERDHPAAHRRPPQPRLPEPSWLVPGTAAPAMAAVDRSFTRLVQLNPELRPRIGNPDELRSNGMNAALDLLEHRVTDPEPGVAEARDGKVITALNEEAVVCAALANKAGLNLVVTYEAFAPKMLGAVRQEIIFARHQRDVGQEPGWLAVPLILTSHTWENGKNEQSHQDPTMAEALLGEMNDVSRVVFAADANAATALLESAFAERGQIWTMVVAKRPAPVRLTGAQARTLASDGAVALRGRGGEDERVLLVALGSYQLGEVLRASERLEARGVGHAVVYLGEPGRFRQPRDQREEAHLAPAAVRDQLFPASAPLRVFVCHTRPEAMAGALRPLDTGAERSSFLGYRNRGGTLDTFGMLFANGCTWAHVVAEVARLSGRPASELLEAAEIAAIEGRGDPRTLEPRH
jgi:phosphoketolase